MRASHATQTLVALLLLAAILTGGLWITRHHSTRHSPPIAAVVLPQPAPSQFPATLPNDAIRLILPPNAQLVAATADGRRGLILSGDISDATRNVKYTLYIADLAAATTLLPSNRLYSPAANPGVLPVLLPDNEHAITASPSGLVRLWDLQTGDEVARWNTGYHIDALAVSPNGKRFAIASVTSSRDGICHITLCEIASQLPIMDLNAGPWKVTQLAFSEGGVRLISAGEEKFIRVWDLSNGSLIDKLAAHTGPVQSISVAPDGLLLSGGSDGRVCLWDLWTCKLIRTMRPAGGKLGGSARIQSVAFVDQAAHFLTADSNGTVRLWETRSGLPVDTFDRYGDHLIALGATGSAIVDGWGPFLWRLPNSAPPLDAAIPLDYPDAGGPIIWRRMPPNCFGTQLAARQSRIVAAGSTPLDLVFRTWNVTDLYPTDDLQLPRPTDGSHDLLALGPDGHSAILGDGPGQVADIRLSDGKPFFHSPPLATDIRAAIVSPDGHKLICETSGKSGVDIIVWQIPSGRLLATLTAASDNVAALAISADGRYLAAAGDVSTKDGRDRTGTIWEWNLFTGQPLQTLTMGKELIISASFSADSRRLIAGSWSGESTVWDVATGTALAHLPHHSDLTGFSGVTAVALSADGSLALTGGHDTNIDLLEAATGRLIHRFNEHQGEITDLCFLSDSHRFVSASDDGTIRLWELP